MAQFPATETLSIRKNGTKTTRCRSGIPVRGNGILDIRPYRGRFAPSPTGELHFGSLVAAVGSYLDARANGGEWIVRIEDVDTTRCHPEFETSILRTLEAYGFEWDGPIAVSYTHLSENPDVSGISNHVDNQNLYWHLQKIRRFRRAGEQGGIPEFQHRTVFEKVADG